MECDGWREIQEWTGKMMNTSRVRVVLNAWRVRVMLGVVALLCGVAAVGAQEQGAAAKVGDDRINLDVVVAPKSGEPVSGLQQQDFTVLDNKAAVAISSFRAVEGAQAQVEVVVVVDAVNTDFQRLAFERLEIEKFLRADGGHLAHPTSLAVVTDTGTQMGEGFSSDGNVLSTTLEKYGVGLRELRRSSGFYGAAERFSISLQALRMIAEREAGRPGRKAILWVSPGWPLLSGPRVVLDPKEQERLFASVVGLSTQLREGRITLYSVDPRGAGEGEFSANYYKEFVKGVRDANHVDAADLSLQVLAIQTGGLVLNFDNRVEALLKSSVEDLKSYYEISFDRPLSDQRDNYHQIEVKVDKPGVTARTRTGYYAQPDAPRQVE